MRRAVAITMFLAAASVAFLCAFLPRAYAQSSGMSFGVQTSTQVYNASLTAYTNVTDNSWGCVHGGYATTARIYSPTNRTASSQSSGLSASVTLPLNGEYGTFTVVTTVNYGCSCMFNQQVSFSQGVQVQPKVPKNIAATGSDFSKYIAPGDYLRRRTWQVVDQTNTPLQRSGMSITESFSQVQNVCVISVESASASTNSQ